MGEGWHNNHHHYQSSVNQGFYWWEIDLTYYGLRALSWLGLVRGLRTPPVHVLNYGRSKPVTLGRAFTILEWFPDAVRDRLGRAEELWDLLPRKLVLQLARAGRKLERLPSEVKEHLARGRKALERLPGEIRAVLPSPDDLLASADRFALSRVS
jgi:hypothetical protein